MAQSLDELTKAQEEELASWLVPGTVLRVYYGEGNPNNATIEIRGIVDDQVVYRSGAKGAYRIVDRYQFELWMEKGRLSKADKRERER